MKNKEIALQKITNLVARFNEQLPTFKDAKYKEHNLRTEFLNPFWEALGWDINNKQGKTQSYKEVEHEDTLKVDKQRGAPDYCFRKDKDKRFFYVEAKKPIENIKDNNHHALQTRTYGWCGKLNISILSDFEEFSIYDCTKKPKNTDNVQTARLQYFTFNEYIKNFDFLWDTFSRDAVFNGSIDQYASKKIKKGNETVDKEFLKSLDTWRTILAENISTKNKNKIDEDGLNFAVQHIIDRFIFLRIAEDRNIEPYGQLKQMLHGENFYKNIVQIFAEANTKYNAGLFDFKKDTITQNLIIENKVIKSIINEMYYPQSPYLFDVISVEILGSAYEQFLGKTITINTKGKAIIELKPEVRKAGGVYYTPQYIVDYIVENTVGKLIEQGSMLPCDIEKIKIVDPACGSGSFLLGAYQYLLNWHKEYYTTVRQAVGAKGGKEYPLTPDGNLTTAEKKRILLNNIYGVDIDNNAVEVTKLSLLLKCMEGETNASIAYQISMFSEKVLPTLDNNIKSGNSLIDTDYYDNQLDFGEERKIKPFNWQKAFPDVFNRNIEIDTTLPFKEQYNKVKKLTDETNDFINQVQEPTVPYGKNYNGGFDVVIGNPPYVSIKEIATNQKKYFNDNYEVATGQFDLYILFIEKAFSLLNNEGLMGMITSNTYINNKDTKKLREIILKTKNINEIINLGETVFADANLDVSILILKNKFDINVQTKITTNNINFKTKMYHFINQKIWLENNTDFVFNINISSLDFEIINKLFQNKKPLSSFLNLPRGIEIGSNSELISKIKSKTNLSILYGRSINKYQIIFDNNFIEFDKNNKSVFKDYSIYNQEKILIQRIRNLSLKQRIVATIDNENYVCTNTLRIGNLKETNLSIKYLLGILNSKIINWIFLKKFLNKDIYAYQLEQLPIKTIDFNNQQETEIHHKIVQYVDQLLQINKEIQMVVLATQIEQLKTKIDYFEDKINELVYQLYNLTNEEIQLIENCK